MLIKKKIIKAPTFIYRCVISCNVMSHFGVWLENKKKKEYTVGSRETEKERG